MFTFGLILGVILGVSASVFVAIKWPALFAKAKDEASEWFI